MWDQQLSRPDVLNDWNPSLHAGLVTLTFSLRPVVPHHSRGRGVGLMLTPPPERLEEHKRAEVQAGRKLFFQEQYSQYRSSTSV